MLEKPPLLVGIFCLMMSALMLTQVIRLRRQVSGGVVIGAVVFEGTVTGVVHWNGKETQGPSLFKGFGTYQLTIAFGATEIHRSAYTDSTHFKRLLNTPETNLVVCLRDRSVPL